MNEFLDGDHHEDGCQEDQHHHPQVASLRLDAKRSHRNRYRTEEPREAEKSQARAHELLSEPLPHAGDPMFRCRRFSARPPERGSSVRCRQLQTSTVWECLT